MDFVLCDLNESVRGYMLREVEADVAAGSIYLSKRFSDRGRVLYADLLRDAVRGGDGETLAQALRTEECFVRQEWSRRIGDWKKVPSDAAETLAEGEFNRYYMRGVCASLAEHPTATVEVYRAKGVREPRLDSEVSVGSEVPSQQLLADLRGNTGSATTLGLGKPNSGLSVRVKGLPVPCHDRSLPVDTWRPGCRACLDRRFDA